MRTALAERLTELNAPTSGLRSRLLRALPTTMALVALQRSQPGAFALGRVTCSGPATRAPTSSKRTAYAS